MSGTKSVEKDYPNIHWMTQERRPSEWPLVPAEARKAIAELTRLREEVEESKEESESRLEKLEEIVAAIDTYGYSCDEYGGTVDAVDCIHKIGKLAEAEPRACPCLYGDPCSPECACVNQFSSIACNRCCTHGGDEQRAFAAKQIIGDIEAGRRLQHLENCLRLQVERDACDLYWPGIDDDGNVSLSVMCSDWFYWATADCELVTIENFPQLEQAFVDAVEADPKIGEVYGGELFVCRIRGMRPQGAQYKNINPTMWPIFDACGPDRPADKDAFGNPHHQSEYKTGADDE